MISVVLPAGGVAALSNRPAESNIAQSDVHTAGVARALCAGTPATEETMTHGTLIPPVIEGRLPMNETSGPAAEQNVPDRVGESSHGAHSPRGNHPATDRQEPVLPVWAQARALPIADVVGRKQPLVGKRPMDGADRRERHGRHQGPRRGRASASSCFSAAPG